MLYSSSEDNIVIVLPFIGKTFMGVDEWGKHWSYKIQCLEIFCTKMAALQVVTLGSLLGTWLYEQTLTGEKWKDIRDTSKLILLIASIQYIITLATRGTPISEQIRYLDWLLTTPLLLRMVYLYAIAKLDGEASHAIEKTFFFILIADVLMVVLGYLGEYVYPEIKIELSVVSFLFLLVIVGWIFYLRKLLHPVLSSEEWEIFSILSWFFIGLWWIYGFAFYLESDTRSNIFSVLDLLNKAVFSLIFLKLLEVTDRQELLMIG